MIKKHYTLQATIRTDCKVVWLNKQHSAYRFGWSYSGFCSKLHICHDKTLPTKDNQPFIAIRFAALERWQKKSYA